MPHAPGLATIRESVSAPPHDRRGPARGKVEDVGRGIYDCSTLCFRRQFVLGPHFVEKRTKWKRITVRAGLCITAHPDLGTCQVTDADKSVTLLGFILDPTSPAATDAEILGGLLQTLQASDDLDTLVAATFGLGGRWILIADNGRQTRLFHDAGGLRQVYYTRSSGTGANWCASDPGVIAEMLGLQEDREAKQFITSYEQVNKEYWWPGDTSLYGDVRKLLPNHYLDLTSYTCLRYWPRADLTELPLAECVRRSSEILLGMMDSAERRFKLALTVTAGWDSRVALAATRPISRDVLYFTLMYWDMSPQSDDIHIPSRLLPKLGVRHHVITCPSTMDEEFASIYNKNVTNAHVVYGTIAQGLYNAFPQDRVMVKAVVSEVARCWYRQRVPDAANATVNSRMLAEVVQMQPSTFVLTAFDRWLAGADRGRNIDLLDLLFWEQRMGSWQAMSQLEWDIVQDVFTPFNCRTLLTHCLSVAPKYREPKDPILYSELMNRMWPEVLAEPINPSKKKRRARPGIRQFIIDSRMRHLVPPGLRKLGRRFLYPPRRF